MHVSHDLYINDLPQDCIDDCSGPGQADTAVQYWCDKLQFTVDQDRARQCLQGYGAWDDSELMDETANTRRILWLACGNFKEWQVNPDCGSDIFVLES